MRVPICEIKIAPGRRDALPEQVENMVSSMKAVGLLTPILIDQEHTLIAGLHRLEAAKRLNWTEIECTVRDLTGLQAELAQIDENFIRCELPVVEHAELMMRRKEIYEQLHPETRHGGDHKSKKIKRTKDPLDSVKSFAEDTAQKLGVHPRTVRREVQIARNLTPAAKEILRNSDAKIGKKTALKLSRLEPEQQKEAASQLASGQIDSLHEYQSNSDKHQPDEQNATEESDASEPPFKLDDYRYKSFQESVADLKNVEKDFHCTPDVFLAEFSGFVEQIHQGITWYTNEYHTPAFADLSPVQLRYLREKLDGICALMDDFYHTVKGEKPSDE